MSYVTTHPEALDFAAGKLEGIGTSLAAQNAAAAASTTGVLPAAADEVSALQATQFAAYGNLYQQVSAQAAAIHQAFVQMLGTSAGSYGATEAANSAATGTASLGGFSLLGQLTQFGQFGLIPGALNNGSLIGIAGGQQFGAAASDFLGLIPLAKSAGAGAGAASAASAGLGELGGLSLSGTVQPVSAAGVGAAPVLAGVGQASAVGGLSIPPSWAAGAVPAASPAPATLAGAGWTSAAAPNSAPVTTVPGGVPSVASTGRASGLGVPRYGVKPKVMPKPTVV
jgi:PE family/PPE-SVP subfamily C-terminal region